MYLSRCVKAGYTVPPCSCTAGREHRVRTCAGLAASEKSRMNLFRPSFAGFPVPSRTAASGCCAIGSRTTRARLRSQGSSRSAPMSRSRRWMHSGEESFREWRNGVRKRVSRFRRKSEDRPRFSPVENRGLSPIVPEGLSLRCLSFAAARRAAVGFQNTLRHCPTRRHRAGARGLMLLAIVQARIPKRPDRMQPRAIKRRPKPLRLPSVPREIARQQLREQRRMA